MATVKQMLEYGMSRGMEMSESVNVLHKGVSVYRPFKQYERFSDAEILAMARKVLRKRNLKIVRI